MVNIGEICASSDSVAIGISDSEVPVVNCRDSYILNDDIFIIVGSSYSVHALINW